MRDKNGDRLEACPTIIMKKLLLAVSAGFAFSMFMAAASAGPVFQMRLAEDTASDGAERMSYTTHYDGHDVTNVIYVQKAVLIGDSMLKSAKVMTDAFGHSEIELTFNETGTKRFAEVTRQNIDKKLAIIINGEILQAPVIRMEISGGQAVISGSFSKEEASDLVKKLNDAAKKAAGVASIEG